MKGFKKWIWYLIIICPVLTTCDQESIQGDNSAEENSTPPGTEQEVVYHLFQRSFYDNNGDGHGDLNGLVSKLDYLTELGVSSILMTPLYESIFYHNYFADDFETIDAEYGSKEDYFNMVSAIHQHGLKFYMDMEVQYVTKNHPWYGDSFENPDSEFSNYVIYNGPGNTNPESIIFDLTELESYNGDKLAVATIDMYNQAVKTYMTDLFKYWVDPNEDGNFEDGVDGFRIDHMMDDLDWKGIRTNLLKDFWAPLIGELKSINPDLKIIAEQSDWNDLGEAYFAQSDVDMMFAFSIRNGVTNMDKTEIVDAINNTMMATPENKYQLIFLENHDLDRYASVVDRDIRKMKLGSAIIFMIKGIPLVYYGQELGMTGKGGFGKYGNTDANDIPRREAFEWYREVDGQGMALWYKNTGPWWEETNLVPNDGISYEEQRNDEHSLFSFYKSLIQVRKLNSVLAAGNQEIIDNNSPEIISIARWQGNSQVLIAFNLSDKTAEALVLNQNFPFDIKSIDPEVLISDGISEIFIDQNAIKITLPPFGYATWGINGYEIP